eukprot:scaffold115144_cov23-Tisochrysis_lutea.AAC.1
MVSNNVVIMDKMMVSSNVVIMDVMGQGPGKRGLLGAVGGRWQYIHIHDSVLGVLHLRWRMRGRGAAAGLPRASKQASACCLNCLRIACVVAVHWQFRQQSGAWLLALVRPTAAPLSLVRLDLHARTHIPTHTRTHITHTHSHTHALIHAHTHTHILLLSGDPGGGGSQGAGPAGPDRRLPHPCTGHAAPGHHSEATGRHGEPERDWQHGGGHVLLLWRVRVGRAACSGVRALR